MSESTPLPADPARQADAMLSACDYQIWQTISAWLDLRGDETLYIEGAEDFDTVSAEGAETVQVKASVKPISLARADVQEALNNFWKVSQASPHIPVLFRYLTRAPFTVERERPFGQDIAGLELWNRSVLTDEETHMLAAFLMRQERLRPDLKLWLQNASVANIRSQLVDRVIWETNSENISFVEQAVYGKLVTFAETVGHVPPSTKIKQVAQRLGAEVWKMLRKPAPRRVDRFRLLEIWDEETRVSIPQAELDARMRQLAAPVPAVLGPGLFRPGPPPLPGVVTGRSDLVTEMRHVLGAMGLLNLHGSTRTGKTTIAKLIARSEADAWRWWSAARKTPTEVQRELLLLAQEATRQPEITSILLDDLDFSPPATGGLEDTLGELLATVRGRRGRAVITSQKPLPARLQHAFGVTARQIVSVPRLEVAEIEELALALGCPDERRRTIWSRLVHAITGGHPQLAAVHLFTLRDRGWPEVTAETMNVGSTAIDAEKTDARQLLVELPESQRVLLHRLSVFPHIFLRNHAVAFGAVVPPLVAPGDLFDSLIGPWIEPLHASYFAVSPLITDCARHASAPADFHTLQDTAAKILVNTEPATTTEGAMAFLLVWETENESALIGLTQSWFGMDEKLFTALATDLLWFTFVATKPGQQLFPKNHTLSLALRSFQFRVAAVTAPNCVEAIVSAWMSECEPVASGGDPLARLVLAGLVLPYSEVGLSPTTIIELLEEAAATLEANPDLPIPPVAEQSFPELDYIPLNEDLVSTLAFFCSRRCASVDFLDQFLTALESTSPELRVRILRGFIGGGISVQLAIDRAWLAESDRPTPDWTRCLAVFERAFNLACTWQVPELAVAVMRGVAVVLDEYVADHAAAHEAIDRLARQGALDSHHVYDRRASVYFSEGNYDAAEQQWRMALERWPTRSVSFDHGVAFAARGAGISAARLGRWEAAARWFLQIPQRLSAEETAFIAVAYADAGFAWWKAGRPEDAITALIEAWQHADTLPRGKEDLRAFQVRKIIGHVIAWLHGVVARVGEGDLSEPQPGMCTSAALPEKLRDLPETDSEVVWFFLMHLERTLDLGRRAAELGAKHLQSTSSPSVRAMAAVELVADALATGVVSELPKQLIQLLDVMQNAAQQFPPDTVLAVTRFEAGAFGGDDALLGSPVFLAALVSAATHGTSWKQTVDSWRSCLTSTPHTPDWDNWIAQIEEALNANLSEAAIAARDHTGRWVMGMLGSLNILLSSDSSPDDLYLAHARWLSSIASSPWLRQTAAMFCGLVESAWLRVIQTPALLRAPALNIPSIQHACSNGKPSLAKAVHIFEAATPAVGVRASSGMISIIRSLLDGPKEGGGLGC